MLFEFGHIFLMQYFSYHDAEVFTFPVINFKSHC